MADDYFDKVTKSATTLLARWDGRTAVVRELTVSLRSLHIVLFDDSSSMPERNLLLAAAPLWMTGPFAWQDAKLRVEVVSAASVTTRVTTNDLQLFRLHDPVGFELLTGSLEVKENVRLH